jgi:DNA-binding IclR family transcriptional regulator
MIQAVERAAKILRIVAECERGIRLCDLSKNMGLNRNTVYNLAETLVKETLLTKSPDTCYFIGDGVMELAQKKNCNIYREKASKYLTALHSDYPNSSIFYSELSSLNIAVKLRITQNPEGEKISYSENVSLNPYLTVAGLVFFAFAGKDKMNNIMSHNPFEYTGLNAWGSMKNFMKNVHRTRKNGYAETPGMTLKEEFKIGVPVKDLSENLNGAITFHLYDSSGLNKKDVLQAVLNTAKKIGKKLES